jgi:hypothetical protein
MDVSAGAYIFIRIACSRHTAEDVTSNSELQRLIMSTVELILDPESEQNFNLTM